MHRGNHNTLALALGAIPSEVVKEGSRFSHVTIVGPKGLTLPLTIPCFPGPLMDHSFVPLVVGPQASLELSGVFGGVCAATACAY